MAWIRLGLAQGVGRPWARRAVEALGSPRAAAEADVVALRPHMAPAPARALVAALRRARPERIIRRATDLGQVVLTPADSAWPAARFEGLVDAPCCLFLRGCLPPPEASAVAVVGTRNASEYGLRAARDVSDALARAGVWIVSGFALGVDGAAHQACVAARGATVAVLGCGIDHDYPVSHGDLRVALLEHGGLLSEHPPGDEPRRHHFPRRNRLVAALAQAVVVVEAPERSGALITARLALDLGREVLAVPGSIFRRTQAGCHRLLRQGAGLCAGAQDVADVLGLDLAMPPPEAAAGGMDGHAGAVWRALDDEEALDAGALCRRTGLDAQAVVVALTELELVGRARRLPGSGFVRS